MKDKWKLIFGLLAIVLWSAALFAQSAPGKTTASRTVSGTGCVEPGAEAGCLVLRGTSHGRLYNLFFAGSKPAIGQAIRFTGTPKEGVTTCMQGDAVNVKTWRPVKMHCATPVEEDKKK